jgi:hypothetical protein
MRLAMRLGTQSHKGSLGVEASKRARHRPMGTGPIKPTPNRRGWLAVVIRMGIGQTKQALKLRA